MRKLFSWLGLILCLACTAQAADNSLIWRTRPDRIDADIKDWPLPTLLEKMAELTRWQIYVEPGTTLTISAKFKELSTDEALTRLLGKINYSHTESNGTSQLFVYKTDARAATQIVQGKSASPSSPKKYLIPNELVVKLKRGTKRSIEELASMVNGKIIGRDDRYGLYRLQFADEAAANAARAILSKLTDDVDAIEANYTVERPDPGQLPPTLTGGAGPVALLNPKPPVGGGILVGLLDTAVQKTEFDKYLSDRISIAGQSDLSGDTPLHGTGMFETLLEAMSEAPSKVLSADIYGSGETTTTYETALGTIRLVNSGANPINMSLGGTGDSPMLHQIIQEGFNKGILFVAAAGNQGGTGNTFPAAYPEVLSVTAVDPNGSISSYADHGSFVKTAATGTSYITLNGQTWVIQGTSVSTAVISGEIVQLANQKHLSLQASANQVMANHGVPRVR